MLKIIGFEIDKEVLPCYNQDKMGGLMKENYLLKSKEAESLYRAVKDLPIIDYHNHISVADIKSDRRFDNLYEIWLECDPYKHRLMRICGVPEEFITGDRAPYEKFERFVKLLPMLAGNPVYDWAKMELSTVFGIDDPAVAEKPEYLYDKCSEMLRSEEFSTKNILKRFNIEYQSPICSLTDDLSYYGADGLAPSLRGDDLLSPTDRTVATISSKTGIKIENEDSYVKAVSVMLDRFSEKGCRVADHALDSDFFANDTDGSRVRILTALCAEYAKRNMLLLLHLDAKRDTSERLAKLAGPFGGYAAVGGSLDITKLIKLLDRTERYGALPNTVLFPLNLSDLPALSVLQGSFSENGVASKVQLGPAWWWCDHRMGIESTLSSISSFGVLSEFIGMTTDSRSILSFVRHDYFRRILCSFLVKQNEELDWELSGGTLTRIAEKICYENAKTKIGR